MPIYDDFRFRDDVTKRMLQRQKMQHEIIPHIEEMAQKLAAAGVASFMVTGDAPAYAINRWVKVLHARALELLSEKMRDKKVTMAQSIKEAAALEAPKLKDSK